MNRKGKRNIIFVFGCVLLLVCGASFVDTALAGEKLVVVNWGGNDAQAQKECYYDSFEKETGIKVIATSPPLPAKVKAQVDSGNIEWDIILTDVPSIMVLTQGEKVYLEEFDYSKIDSKLLDRIIPETKKKYSIGDRVYSFNICYNTNTFKKDHPRSWADVWDVQKYPGVRSLNNALGGVMPQYEFALLADGVPLDRIYPIDVDRAYKSLDRLKPHVSKFYKSHSQAIQMLVSGEVDIAATIGSFVISEKWKGAPVDVEWNQGKNAYDSWCIVKGSKNKEAAYKLINYMLDPKRQACASTKVPFGRSNMDSSKFVDPEIAKQLNTAPENLSRAFWHGVDWWSEVGPDGKSNRTKSMESYSKWLVK